MNLLDLSLTDPDALAVNDGTRSRSWAELVDRAYRVAHLLRDELGLQPDDHAAILMGNRVEYPEILLNRFRKIALTNTLPRHPNGKGTLSGSQST